MGRIYRDATLTVYAAAAKTSHDGVFQSKSQSERPQRKPAKVKVFPNSNACQNVTVELPDLAQESMATLSQDSPLFRRGWALQEMVLSPRKLFYGNELLYWRCRKGYKSSDDVPPGIRISGFREHV